MAKIFVVGNLGKDPELKTIKTKDGRDAHCVDFSIADNTRVKGADGKWVKHTDWYKVSIWDKQAENFVKYCKSGKQLEICGIIRRVEYIDKKDGTKVRDIEIKPLTIDYGPDSRKNSTYEGQSTGEAKPTHATPPPAAPPVVAAPTLPPAPPGFSWAFMNNTHVLIPTPPAAPTVAPPAPATAQPEMVVISGV
jgi:single stranded DNA-binding protein